MKDTWNEYFIDDDETKALKNNLGINNKNELSIKEKEIVTDKLVDLELNPIEGNFDSTHLKNIHYYLFNDIYPFAGQYRTCSMAKTRDFLEPSKIASWLDNELTKLNNGIKEVQSLDYYAHFLSEEYYNLMYIHPFREGNGRSVREFLREFVIAKNNELPFDIELDFSKMDPEQFLLGVQYKLMYPSILEMEFRKALVNLELKNEKHM